MGQGVSHAHNDFYAFRAVGSKFQQVVFNGLDRQLAGGIMQICQQGRADVDGRDPEAGFSQRNGLKTASGAQINCVAGTFGLYAVFAEKFSIFL